MSIEHKGIRTELKAITDGNGGFEGYASIFGNRDGHDDIVVKGAYTKTLQERKGKIKALWNHDAFGLPIAKLSDALEDNTGLYVKGDFAGTTLAQDVRTLVSEGALDSMSIGYSVVKADYGEQDGGFIRYLLEVKLYEVSIVNMPSNPLAVITGSKSADALERLVKHLDDAINVGIKSGRPLAADHLKRLQSAYQTLGALLADRAEPQAHSDDQGAATQDAEPPSHSDLLTGLKSITFTPTRDEAAILAEIKSLTRTLQGDKA